jgi:hypothetical protein
MSALVVFILVIVYMSVAQFVGLPYWRPDISTESGIIEYLLLSITAITLVSLAGRERRKNFQPPEVVLTE